MNFSLNTNSFEYFFDEKTLKKGLALFERGSVSSTSGKETNEQIFYFKGKNPKEVRITKKRDTILSTTCSCLRKNCEHICASVFYLTKDKLVLNKVIGKKNQDAATKGETLFLNYLKQLKYFVNLKKTDSAKKIDQFLRQEEKLSETIKHLGILNASGNVKLISGFDEGSSNQQAEDSIKFLCQLNLKDLTKTDKEAWFAASVLSIRNNKIFNSGIFKLLIPVTANLIAKKKDFETLKALIHKRQLKQNYLHYLDYKQIALLQLLYAENGLQKKQVYEKGLSAEQSIAKAELKFRLNKTASGFKILEQDYGKILKAKPINFISYIEYIIEKARQFNKNEIEIKYIKEIIVYDHVVPAKHLKRISELLSSEENTDEFVRDLFQRIKSTTPGIYLEKACGILEGLNRPDELLSLLSKREDRFTLVNRIAALKLPAYDNLLLDTYIKHFLYAVSEARETFHQKKILEDALIYLDQLPKPIAQKLILQALNKISKNNFAYSELNKKTVDIQNVRHSF